jgi:hypothetical protein
MKQAIILHSDFTETRHNISSMLLADVLADFLKLGSSVICITIIY